MSQHTLIDWTDSTINGSSGCDGCELFTPDASGIDADAGCYAKWLHERRLARSFPDKYAVTFDQVRMIPGRYMQAARWPSLWGKDRPDKPWMNGRPRHIFVGDMGDFLSEAVTDEFLERELLGAIRSPQGQRHVWQLLTKRPGRLAALSEKWGGLPANVVAMTTVTNQRTAEVRIPKLLNVKCENRGLSVEPLWGPIELYGMSAGGGRGVLGADCIEWVICGGESKVTKARRPIPLRTVWARSLRDQCKAAGVDFFFKQWGEFLPFDQCGPSGIKMPLVDAMNYAQTGAPVRLGTEKAGRLLDGSQHNGMPNVEATA